MEAGCTPLLAANHGFAPVTVRAKHMANAAGCAKSGHDCFSPSLIEFRQTWPVLQQMMSGTVGSDIPIPI
jgi:hypothetical protein